MTKSFPLIFGKLLHITTRVRTIRKQTPKFSKIERFRNYGETWVCLIGRIAHATVQLGNFCPPDLGHLTASQNWIEPLLDQRLVICDGR